jgi:Uma2 family endonuclease
VAAERTSLQIETTSLRLPLLVRPSAPVSDEAFYEFCRANRELRIERTADGEILIMSPTGGETGRRNFALIGQFWAWTRTNREGVGFDSSTGFLLPNGAERSPDLAWVRGDRWSALEPKQRERLVPLCPDFVAELRSPSDDLDVLRDELAEYMACGCELAWLLDPTTRAVHVYRADQEPAILDEPEVVSGEPLLPGFTLELAEIW